MGLSVIYIGSEWGDDLEGNLFREWLQNNSDCKDVTREKYIRSVKTIEDQLTAWGMEDNKINNESDILKILEIPQFIEKNNRGNNMYSVALNYYKKFLNNTEGNEKVMNLDDVVLIKINRSFKENMTPEELYNATSVSWVASFEKTESRDIKYYCAIYQNKIIEVYKFNGYEEELPRRTPSRYILHGTIAEEEIRNLLLGMDVSSIHKGTGNPIKYTSLVQLFKQGEKKIKKENISFNLLISHIQQYIFSKGFTYSAANIKNLYLSIRSKPFVIISGISGTGKTKIVQLFAESLGATEENGQFTLIPVRPDWSDGSELIGYTDIKGDFLEGPLTKIVREATNNLDRPYFVLLDEMNLARVEYYFSDVLSIMESRKKDEDTYTSSTLIEIENEKLTLPNNLYIIGTVNMDETTHPFSKKVLDRANTIEFNEIYLNNFSFLKNTEPVEPIQLSNSSIEAGYIQLKDCYEANKNIVEYVSDELTTINKILEPHNAHVGYRVRDEICFYMIYNDEGSLFERDEAFDYCLMQKILPRLAGSGLKMRTVLEQLFEHFTGNEYPASETFNMTEARYPLSVKKVHDMLGRLGDEGFTSFWIS